MSDCDKGQSLSLSRFVEMGITLSASCHLERLALQSLFIDLYSLHDTFDAPFFAEFKRECGVSVGHPLPSTMVEMSGNNPPLIKALKQPQHSNRVTAS